MLIEAPATGRVEFLGLCFDALDLAGAIAWLRARSAESPFGYVVTPNVDHMLRLDANPDLRPLYTAASLCLNDSRILQRLARGRGVDLSLAPGSDLTPGLLDQVAAPGDQIAIVGGDPALASTLQTLYPHLDFVACHPPMGLARDASAREVVLRWMRANPARFTLLAVGSPQQEMIAADAADAAAGGGHRGTALCIGASLDFVTGTKRRAPRLVQRLSLEWAWRLASEPRRLARRYLIDAPRIFPLVRRWAANRAKLRSNAA